MSIDNRQNEITKQFVIFIHSYTLNRFRENNDAFSSQKRRIVLGQNKCEYEKLVFVCTCKTIEIMDCSRYATERITSHRGTLYTMVRYLRAILFCRLQKVGDRSGAVGLGTAQSTDRRWRRQTGRLRMRLAMDVGTVGREGHEGETRRQHRIRPVVRVSVLFDSHQSGRSVGKNKINPLSSSCLSSVQGMDRSSHEHTFRSTHT